MLVKEYFRDLQRKRHMIKLHKIRIEELSSRAEYVGINWGERTSSTKDPHSNESVIALIIDEKEKLLREITIYQKEEKKAYEMICTLQDGNTMEIFDSRYFKEMKWEDIADSLGVTFQWVHELHRRGLHELGERFPRL